SSSAREEVKPPCGLITSISAPTRRSVCAQVEKRPPASRLIATLMVRSPLPELVDPLPELVSPLPELVPPLPELVDPLPELVPPLPELVDPLPELVSPLPELVEGRHSEYERRSSCPSICARRATCWPAR